MPKYNYSNPFERGRVAFALGLPETSPEYSRVSKDDNASFQQGWDFEYKCNLVRTLKIYERRPVPENLKWYDRACINKHYVDRPAFMKSLVS